MKVVFWNHKGGTGKSTLSYLYGKELMNNGEHVTFYDLDEQHNLSYSLGFPKPKPINKGDNFVLNVLKGFFTIENKGIAIVDCPPSYNQLVKRAIDEADSVVVPFQLEAYSLIGLVKVLGYVDKEKVTLVPNFYQKTKLHDELLGQSVEFAKKNRLKITKPIKRTIKIPTAIADDKMIELNLKELLK